MPSIQAIQEEIVENFSFLPQWDEKYAYLIELGQAMPPMPAEYKTDDNIVRGCQSTVWLHQTFQDGKVQLMADSDSLIVKGLASLLIQIYSGQPPQEILSADLFFFEKTGLSKHLSSQRANGLLAMIEKIKAFAAACVAAGQP
jgi:cysteine desulfuration protein SufE